jgi:hypothetical protein
MEGHAGHFTAADGSTFSDIHDYQNYVADSFYDQDDLDDEDELPPYDASNRYVHSDESDTEDRETSPGFAEEYIMDAKAKANSPRPQSAPSGKVGNARGEVSSETFLPQPAHTAPRVQSTFSDDKDVHISETLKIPSSPYDEEVAFEYRLGDDEDIDSAYLETRRGRAAQSNSSRPVLAGERRNDADWAAENRKFLMASVEADIPNAPALSGRTGDRPRPSSADPRLRHSSMGYMAPRSNSAERFRGRQSLPTGERARSSTPKRGRDVLRTSAEKLTAMKELVEDLVRNTVKKADLYHTIQVIS